jgi:glycosyltransferase involved in cell wall biosynthesis
LERIVLAETPDLIHALRIPYEGVTALTAKTNVPRVVSTWGSDIVPQSTSDPILGRWMRRVLRRVDGFQFDSTQDLDRALERGLPLDIPSLHAAGNFGVEDKLFYVSDEREKGLVVYPRRAKPNANYRGFVAAAIELSNSGGARFVGVGLRAAEAELNEIFEGAEIEAVELTGQLSRAEMATLLRRAEVVVSPTFWDGTPISVLEAVACGAKVIAGTLPELLMLQEQGMDIDLIDASSTPAIVEAIERALGSERMGDASSLPQQFDRRSNQSRVTRFYREVVAERSR